MLDLRKLETFRVLAVTHNFTRAAAQLGCCQSSVTTHIQALERELGVFLFERYRYSKKVTLTKEGRQALEYAGRLLALAEEAKAAVHLDIQPKADTQPESQPARVRLHGHR